MKSSAPALCIFAALAITAAHLGAEDAGGEKPDREVDALLLQLKHEDMDQRVAALRELMTSLDPRLPEALLPLLADEGNSTRRLAARAVGSRYWQIPKDRIPAFLAALQKNGASEFDDEKNMVARALGLLRRDYAGTMFARSADRRWVIYERRGLPCLIDTEDGSEELVGWSPDDHAWVSASWGNGPLHDSVFWHKTEPVALFSMLLNRKESTLWVWRHKSGLTALRNSTIAAALGIKEDEIFGPGGFFTDRTGWEGDEIILDTFCSSQSGDTITDHEATLAWNYKTNSLRVLSHKRAGQ